MGEAKRRKQLDPRYGEIRGQWRGRNTVRSVKVDASVVKAYFEDPELLDWIKEVWGGDCILFGDITYTASGFLVNLCDSIIISPDAFTFDHTIQLFLDHGRQRKTIGGINMETGVLWTIKSGEDKIPSSGLVFLNHYRPDWKKSLLDFVPKPHYATISKTL